MLAPYVRAESAPSPVRVAKAIAAYFTKPRTRVTRDGRLQVSGPRWIAWPCQLMVIGGPLVFAFLVGRWSVGGGL